MGLAISWVPILKWQILAGAKQAATLTQANDATWKDIPGHYGIDIANNHYFFNCINPDDVIYKGVKPIYEQHGPYIYKEFDQFTDVVYDVEQPVLGLSDEEFSKRVDGAKTAPGLTATYNQYLKYDVEHEDQAEGLNSTLKVVNQAAFGVWWGQINSEKWRFMLLLLFNVVNDLGRQLGETGAYTQIQSSEMASSSGLNDYFFKENPLTQDQIDALWSDPIYGFNNADHFGRWAGFNPEADPARSLILEMEVKTFFGLSHAQVSEFKDKWKSTFTRNENLFIAVGVLSKMNTTQGVGYWQWAAAHTTNDLNQPPLPSVTKVVDTVSGYPEIIYWRDAWLCPNISAENKEALCGVEFFRNKSDPNIANFEYLFNLSSGGDKYLDPEPSSLFNVQTLKKLIACGEGSVDIIANKTTGWAVAVLPLQAEWESLSVDLGFCDAANEACDTRRAYMLWLWMDTLFYQTFQRTQDGGNLELGVMPSLGALSFEQNMNIMHLELPLIVYGHLLIDHTSSTDCSANYLIYGFTPDQIYTLCNNSNSFNNGWTNNGTMLAIDSAVNLLNLYFYGDQFNQTLYSELLTLANMTDAEFQAAFRDANSAFGQLVEKTIAPEIQQWYKNESFCSNTTYSGQCSFAQMAYGQWAFGSVTKKPMPSMQKYIASTKYANETEWSYSRLYSNISQLSSIDFTPEVAYYSYKAASTTPGIAANVSMETILANMDLDHLFNQELWGDLWLGLNKSSQADFNNVVFKKYLKYATIQTGLMGMFTERTPHELIKGYNDPLVQQLAELPPYLGGDQTADPFLSIEFSPTNPRNNSMAFLSGAGDQDYDYLFTRLYSKWLGQTNVYIQGKDYETINKTVPILIQPWVEAIQINGTDGNQFHPDVLNDEILSCFVNNFAKAATFTYKESEYDTYPSDKHSAIEMMKFYLAEKEMQNQVTNPANKNFNTVYDGTINLSTVLRADSIGTKGHFYQLADELSKSVPTIQHPNGTIIHPDPFEDETWLGVERQTGVDIQARQRLQINFMVNGSNTDPGGLFDSFEDDLIIPFVFVKRDSLMTDAQVSAILGDLYTASAVKLPILIGLITIGLLFAVCGACCFKKYRQMHNEMTSYGALERANLIQERKYAHGLDERKKAIPISRRPQSVTVNRDSAMSGSSSLHRSSNLVKAKNKEAKGGKKRATSMFDEDI